MPLDQVKFGVHRTGPRRVNDRAHGAEGDASMQEQRTGICECGCGQSAPIAQRTNTRLGYVKGQPHRFIMNHDKRVDPRLRVKTLPTLSAGTHYAVAGDCWLWLGRRNDDGYGSYSGKGAHIIAWVQAHGPVPDGMELDHLCRVRACVNPEHLEPVSHAENMRRSAPAMKTRCANGHPYDAANTYLRPNGTRDCRACGRERVRKYNARRAA